MMNSNNPLFPKDSSLLGLYQWLQKNHRAVLEYGIYLYRSVLEEHPDLQLIVVKLHDRNVGVVVLNNARVLSHLPQYVADHLRDSNNAIISRSNLEVLIQDLDKRLRLNVFRMIANIGDGEVLSEYILATYHPRDHTQ